MAMHMSPSARSKDPQRRQARAGHPLLSAEERLQRRDEERGRFVLLQQLLAQVTLECAVMQREGLQSS